MCERHTRLVIIDSFEQFYFNRGTKETQGCLRLGAFARFLRKLELRGACERMSRPWAWKVTLEADSVFATFAEGSEHHACSESARSQFVLLDVVEDEGEGLGLLAVVLDGDGGGALHLLHGAVLLVLAVTEPLAKIKAGVNLNQGDAVGLSESLEKK